jgi:hypothetical protein
MDKWCTDPSCQFAADAHAHFAPTLEARHAALVAAAQPIAALAEEDVRDYEQGLCFFCGKSMDWGKGKRHSIEEIRSRVPAHDPDCSWVALRAALIEEAG